MLKKINDMEIDSPNSIGISTGFGIPTGGYSKY